MKTRSVIQLLLTSFILISVTSCQEEEFFEKEYIESFKDKYEEEQSKINDVLDTADSPNDDNASTDDNANNDGDEGEASTDDGTTNDDSNSGGSNGGDDTEENGNNDGDNTNNDGDDANNDGNDSGDDSDNSDDENTGPATISVQDSFTQSASSLQKLDILWVVDDSGSMRQEQENLGRNFNSFIEEFSTLGIDFKMSITTTDTRSNYDGKPVENSLEKLTSDALAQDRTDFLQNFNSMVQVGTRGWGYEKGLKASESFVTKHAAENFREDAYFVVIYVSDEEDQSEKSVSEYLEGISSWKTNPGLVKTYSIVNTAGTGHYTSGYQRYKEMSDLTGGYIADINADFYTTLLKMGGDIAKLTKSFPLSQTPFDASAIKVLVDGVESSRWTYDEATRTISFEDGHEPNVNETINITYEVES